MMKESRVLSIRHWIRPHPRSPPVSGTYCKVEGVGGQVDDAPWFFVCVGSGGLHVLRRLRCLRSRPGLFQMVPQAHSVMSSCPGRVNGVAFFTALSTYSWPRTARRTSSPSSKSRLCSSAIFGSVVDIIASMWNNEVRIRGRRIRVQSGSCSGLEVKVKVADGWQ